MNKNIEFIEEFGTAIFDELFSVIYGDIQSDIIKISKCRKTSPINKTGIAVLTMNGKKIFINWIDGDFNGSEILDYSDMPFEKEKNYATIYKIKPISDQPLALKKYDVLKNSEWFQKLEHELNYDFYHSPTIKIKEHYQKRVEAMYGKIVAEEIECD